MVEEAMRTVGTNGSPVSWLHQRAVALMLLVRSVGRAKTG